ncbi:hypothetical protein CCY99_06715 [Helicobacter sp. 16-1353]|uniref:hypothetical protein n=1 Tax=Helicobacter sp. 16-1353 TaxID=2004996 RepID=UPI000DCD3664|nr:hypothetical protein [Helicobacter sp. 16-1353]RAX53054.1 hypothetical protein CCY99_06715 [Helicobacter sp. 16-1353]
MKIIIFICCFVFCGCGFYNNSFKPEVLAEKKILSSRKAEIVQNGKVVMVVIATYLNNVNPDIYNTREYFFIEVFSELDIPLIYYMTFSITNNERFLWIREVDKDEFDDVLNVSNKWSKGFLIAFDDIDEYDKKNMKLNLVVDTIGEMNFDFTYEVFEMQL